MIGLGVLPVVAGLAALWRAPDEPVPYALRVFRSVLLAAIITFGVYTAVKATYVSIELRHVHVRAQSHLSRAAAVCGHRALARASPPEPDRTRGLRRRSPSILILTTPYEMGQDLSYNAPGLAILQQGNRYLQFDPTGAKIGLIALLALLGRPAAGAALSRPRHEVAPGRGCSRRRRVEPHRGDLLRVGIEPCVGPFRRKHPRALHLGGRRHRRSVDALHRPADDRPERRVAARVLEPVDQGGLESRRDRARARPVPDSGSRGGGRCALT